MDLYKIPGLVFKGFVQAENINGGNPIPLFECKAPTDKPSINTLEGWCAAVDAHNRHNFRLLMGRDPIDEAEFQAWVPTQFTRK